ncbi:DUF2511 domain-containing protein [Alicycliphilus denitrificans]|uniref:DUF2511 domain-containing protein n=1 Tax=Alicycliphilus denitrificans TaxID=179636 RepID=UPI0001DA0DEA|nr:DUF2511 domain-containing protein [Alicycliphilus denitrificans]ADV01286.1 Protein of unknown function DUF2511 [Alicycliphilus denitrificans BC]
MRTVAVGVVVCVLGAAAQAVSAQVRCTMPNGQVIEQRLSSVCPRGASKAETLDGKPAGVRPPSAVPAAPVVTDRLLRRSQVVTRAEFASAWPLTVERGTLRCMYPVPTMPQLHAHLVVVDGVFYALNGVAHSHAAKMGWRPIDAIWRDNQAIPGTKVPITPLVQRAAQLC